VSKKSIYNRKIQDFMVVFDKEGNLSQRCHQNNGVIDPWLVSRGYTSKKNELYPDHLEYAGYYSSGTTSHIEFRSLNSSRLLHMFISDFDEVITEKRFINNQIIGMFSFCRKGNSQGVRLLFEDP